MTEEEIKYCKWLNILVFIKNSIALICFTTLAIVFKHWWIVFFAILFISNVKFKKENKDE